MEEAPHIQSEQSEGRFNFGAVLVGITGLFLIAVGGLMVQTLFAQLSTYQRLIDVAIAKGTAVEGGMALAYARAFDSAVMKTCGLFLSFMLLLLGGLYTFRVGESQYRLSAEGSGVKGSLETASPGLVICTMGLIIVSMVILRDHTIEVSGMTSTTAVNPTTAQRESKDAVTPNGVTVTTSTGLPTVDLSSVRQPQVRAISAAMSILDTQKGALTPLQAKGWDSARPRLDALRSELIVSLFPRLRGKWAEWAKQAALNPDFLQSLPEQDRRQLEAARSLIEE